MVNIGNKTFIAIIGACILIAVFAMCVALNVVGLGDALAGFGGPVAAGFYEVFAFIPRWALSVGWPTLAVGAIIIPILLAVGLSYIVWTKDVPYKLHLATDPNAAGTGQYQNAPQQNTIPITGLQEKPSNQKEANKS